MKRRDVTLGIGTLPLIAIGAAAAQPAGNFRQQVVRLLDGYAAAWKASDSVALAALYTPDVHWVNVVGMHWQGREEVEYAHRILFDGPLKSVSETLEEIESVVALPSGGGIAVVRWAVGAYTTPSGQQNPPGRTRMTLVMVPQAGRLKIAHGANIPIVEAAQRSDPVRQRRERRPG